jgi:hypothetical protein
MSDSGRANAADERLRYPPWLGEAELNVVGHGTYAAQ